GWSLSARASSVGGISRPSARAALSTALPAGRRAFPPSGRDPHRFQADGRYPVCSGRSSCRQLEAALHRVAQCCLPLAIYVAMRAQCELVHTGLGRRKKPQPVDGRGKLSRADGEARVRPSLLCIDWSRTLLSRFAHVRGLIICAKDSLVEAKAAGANRPPTKDQILRRERPRSRRAADERDEIAPLHSITSSARARSVGGTSKPSAFAVIRLMTKSNLVGCSTGRSPGLAPRRI